MHLSSLSYLHFVFIFYSRASEIIEGHRLKDNLLLVSYFASLVLRTSFALTGSVPHLTARTSLATNMYLLALVASALISIAVKVSGTVRPSNAYCGVAFHLYVRVLDKTELSIDRHLLKARYASPGHYYAILEAEHGWFETPRVACLNGTNEDIQAGRGNLLLSGYSSGWLSRTENFHYGIVINKYDTPWDFVEINEGRGTEGFYYHPSSTGKRYVFGYKGESAGSFYACPRKIANRPVVQLFHVPYSELLPFPTTEVMAMGCTKVELRGSPLAQDLDSKGEL
ncbi:MAG: hypothetical protein LQ338_007251 [Usnochroma carphineum]|nr:MAG: hypothetical protein LQ338_007251 [Usnochroma carphineum]